MLLFSKDLYYQDIRPGNLQEQRSRNMSVRFTLCVQNSTRLVKFSEIYKDHRKETLNFA